ncbi:hypothetical protein [Desulfococcus sp.]|uniref:hypothetical protein n=1 Tax=Desulfococcus sp. TaxID=2025834 RepID=UPI003593F6BC
MNHTDENDTVKPVQQEGGVTYYTKTMERRVFFILTIVMLILGVLYKFGWL